MPVGWQVLGTGGRGGIGIDVACPVVRQPELSGLNDPLRRALLDWNDLRPAVMSSARRTLVILRSGETAALSLGTEPFLPDRVALCDTPS
jgi:hypothetical protein